MKKIFTILFLPVLSCQIAFGQSSTGAVVVDKWYNIEDFSKGLTSHVSPYLIQKGGSAISQNVRYNERFGSLAKRAKMLQLSACRSAAVKSLYRYYKSDSTQFTIQTASTFMDYISDAGACTNLATGLSDGKRWKFVTYKDVVIGTNGTDRAKKWDGKLLVTANTDGHRTAGDLIADLGAPFAELNTGSNLDASSWYMYKVAFYNGSSYSYSNAASNPIQTGAAVRDITLTDIPIGPTGTTTRYIFRTEGQANRSTVVGLGNSGYKLVASIANNTARTYNDAIADGSLTTAYDTWISSNSASDVTPPYAKYSLISKERLFMANDPSGTVSGKSTIYWSDVNNPDFFSTASDYELIRPDDGDEITVIANDPLSIKVGKQTSWSKFYTDASDDSDWTIGAPFSNVGCVAPYSAAETQTGLIFLGRHGLYTLNGQSVELISDVVTDVVRDVLETSQDDVVGVYHDNQYFMAYTSESTGASTNDRVLLLDLVRNSYTQDTKSIDSWADFNSGDDFGVLYSGSSTTDGKVYAHSNAFSNLVYRYKTQFTSGTEANVYVGGDEEDPYVRLGWDETWATVAGAWSAQGSATWLVEASSGTWTSPAIQIDATALDKLYWNESLGSAGNVTFAVRLASTEGGISGASWSSEFTNPSGSDISGVTANTWIQIRATFTTTDFTIAPEINLENDFVFHMTYQKVATTAETSILSIWKGGFTDFGGGENPVRIKEVQIFYEGTAGTLTVTYENDNGASYSFDIDLSVSPSASSTDNYFGNSTEKYFVHVPTITESRIGRKWRFSITENGATAWRVNRIAARADINAYVISK